MQTFHIQNMTCGGCVRGVTRAIQSVDPAARVHADVPARRVQVVSNQPREIVEATLTKSRYQAVWIAP
jgi:copper chaperone